MKRIIENPMFIAAFIVFFAGVFLVYTEKQSEGLVIIMYSFLMFLIGLLGE